MASGHSFNLRTRSRDKAPQPSPDPSDKMGLDAPQRPGLALQRPVLKREQRSKAQMRELEKREQIEEGRDKIIAEYGGFRHIDDWELTLNGQPCKLDGFVVQRVTRRFIVQKRRRSSDEKKNWKEAVDPEKMARVRFINPRREDGWVDVTPDEIARWEQAPLLFLDCLEYWECFDVIKGEAEHGDQFRCTGFRPPDRDLEEYQFRGTYEIKGEARFYPLTDAQKLKLMETLEGVPLADGLPSTTQDPTPFLVHCLPEFEGVSSEERLTVTSEWDSNVRYGDSKVKPKRGHILSLE